MQAFCRLFIYLYWISSSLNILCLNLWIWSIFSGSAQAWVDQPDEVITVALGNTVTLRCYSDKDDIFWYKQIAGQQPHVMSAFYKLQEPKFYREFKNDRFQGKRLSSSSNLTISSIIQSDEAVYYCGSKASYIEFGNGTHLIIKGKISKWMITVTVSPNSKTKFALLCVYNLFVKIMHICKLQNRCIFKTMS